MCRGNAPPNYAGGLGGGGKRAARQALGVPAAPSTCNKASWEPAPFTCDEALGEPGCAPANTMGRAGLKPGSASVGLPLACHVSPTRAACAGAVARGVPSAMAAAGRCTLMHAYGEWRNAHGPSSGAGRAPPPLCCCRPGPADRHAPSPHPNASAVAPLLCFVNPPSTRHPHLQVLHAGDDVAHLPRKQGSSWVRLRCEDAHLWERRERVRNDGGVVTWPAT